ncbi:MAG: hypothetical protein ACKVOO_11400 [Burkholderiaceae bacterium]
MNTENSNPEMNSQEHAPGEVHEQAMVPAPEQAQAETEHQEQMEQSAEQAMDQAEDAAELQAQQMADTGEEGGQSLLGSIGDSLQQAGDAVVHATEKLIGKDLDGDGQIG